VGPATRRAGLGQADHFLVQDQPRQGQLVEMLQAYVGRSELFSLLQPPGKALSLPARRFRGLVDRALRRTESARRAALIDPRTSRHTEGLGAARQCAQQDDPTARLQRGASRSGHMLASGAAVQRRAHLCRVE
jgi:hypothetical protein